MRLNNLTRVIVFSTCVMCTCNVYASNTCQSGANYYYSKSECNSTIILENLKINNLGNIEAQTIISSKLQNAFKNAINNLNFATYYDVDVYELSEAQKQNISLFIENAQAHNFEIRGYADSSGTEEYNLILSYKRAAEIENYIKELNPAINTAAKGYGQIDHQPKSRRVEIILK